LGLSARVKKIAKLNSEEKLFVSELLATLKNVPQQMLSIAVSTSGFPVGIGGFTQARLDSAGQLILTSEDGTLQVMDLSETRNRKLMMAVVGDIVSKFKDFVSQMEQEKIPEPPQLQEITTPEPPEPIQPIPVQEEVPVDLPEEVPAHRRKYLSN
jgi:hypothetical protein